MPPTLAKSDRLAPINERDTPKSTRAKRFSRNPLGGREKGENDPAFVLREAPRAVPDVALLAILFVLRNRQPRAKRQRRGVFRLSPSLSLYLYLPPPPLLALSLLVSLARPFGAIWR